MLKSRWIFFGVVVIVLLIVGFASVCLFFPEFCLLPTSEFIRFCISSKFAMLTFCLVIFSLFFILFLLSDLAEKDGKEKIRTKKLNQIKEAFSLIQGIPQATTNGKNIGDGVKKIDSFLQNKMEEMNVKIKEIDKNCKNDLSRYDEILEGIESLILEMQNSPSAADLKKLTSFINGLRKLQNEIETTKKQLESLIAENETNRKCINQITLAIGTSLKEENISKPDGAPKSADIFKEYAKAIVEI